MSAPELATAIEALAAGSSMEALALAILIPAWAEFALSEADDAATVICDPEAASEIVAEPFTGTTAEGAPPP